jgi:uncharacterized protein
LYEKAADGGDVRAMANLGYLFLNGFGVRADFEVARKWLEKGAALGGADSMNNLGALFERLGTPEGYTKARDWYMKAAALGNASAMYQLGMIYEGGKGVAKDSRAARQWYQKAADSGHPEAASKLQKLK